MKSDASGSTSAIKCAICGQYITGQSFYVNGGGPFCPICVGSNMNIKINYVRDGEEDIVPDKEIHEAVEFYRVPYAALRRKLRDFLAERGMPSNPGWTDGDIVAALRAEVKKHHDACCLISHEVEQILGKALRYPELYPKASEIDDGSVCVGEHVPQTLAQEAANKIRSQVITLVKADDAIVEAVEELERVRYIGTDLETMGVISKLRKMLAEIRGGAPHD